MQGGSAGAGVLIVDDQESFRASASALVRELPGLEVCGCAATLSEASTVLVGRAVDVILLDVRMPGEDPLAFAAEVRRNRPGIAVVLVSAYDLLDLPPEILASGVGFLAKEDLTPERLAAVLGERHGGLASGGEA